MGKTSEQILSDIREIKAETDPHDITAPRLGETLEDMHLFARDMSSKIESLPAPSEQNYKGKISVSDLLSLSGMGNNDLYLVYSAGNDDEGWSDGGSFTLNGNSYADGTFVQWMGNGWMAVSDTDVNISKSAIFDPQPDKIYVVAKTFPQTSYDHLYGRSKSGMTIAEVESYQLDEESGAYKPIVERMTGQYAGQTSRKTLVIPYARSYQEGGEMHYQGGVLDSEDYRCLKEYMASGSLFFATYGRTTLSEIRAAVQEGKEVLMLFNSDMYRLSMLAGSHALLSTIDNMVRVARIDSNGDWSVNEYILAQDTVRYSVSQDLSETQQARARQNIGAGTSDFSGDYNDLDNKPTIPDTSDFVTKAGQQTIQGKKTFDNYQWGQIAVRTSNGSYYDSPCISFQATVGQVAEGVGSIGVRRTGYLTGYPAYWASDNGNPQRLIREEERGNELTPIYIDSYGKTYECNLYDYVVFEQTGTYYNYSFTRIGGTEGVNVLFDIMESSASVSNMLICISISDMRTATAYSAYMKTHMASVFLTGNGASLSQQVNALYRAWVVEETAQTEAKIVLQLNTEVFEPNTTNRFVVKFERIGI